MTNLFLGYTKKDFSVVLFVYLPATQSGYSLYISNKKTNTDICYHVQNAAKFSIRKIVTTATSISIVLSVVNL